MTILEILFNVIAIITGVVIISSDHGVPFDDKSFKDMVNYAFRTAGLLLLVGGFYHLLGLTMLIPKP